jgi:hypothetical protein
MLTDEEAWWLELMSSDGFRLALAALCRRADALDSGGI